MALKLFSPAKINLFLNVLCRRADGYHELETLFERISLGDVIFLKLIPSGIRLQTNSTNIPQGPKNLVWRAATLLQNRYGVKKGVAIRLQKKIPVAAGLGGGSSNAATVLLGLNRLWKLKLSQKELLGLAAELGSDVPFFVLDTPLALGSGRGEILRKIRPPKTPIWHCLVKPAFGISTKEAYGGLSLKRLTPPRTDVKMLLHSIRRGDSARVSGLLTNSLEMTGLSLAPTDVPQVSTCGLEVYLNKRVTTIFSIKKELVRQGALASLMSGSGSTVFGIFSSKKVAARTAKILKKKNKSWQVFVASTF